MNKNKLIFLGIAVFVGLLILVIISLLGGEEREATIKKDITIWTVGHSSSKFVNLIEEFNGDVEGAGAISFTHRDFESYSDYETALIYELANGQGPDIFMMNNNQKLFLEDAVSGIDPNYISPFQFRKDFLPIFGEELIASVDDPDNAGKQLEFVVGVPAGFETLGLFYDKRSFIGKNLSTWEGVSQAVKDIKDSNPRVTPLGIGHGSSVYGSQDIFTQFLIDAGSEGLQDVDRATAKRALSSYFVYGNANGDNNYEAIVDDMQRNATDNISLFSSGDIKMLIGYPSLIDKIKASGFSKSFLAADPFPKAIGGSDKLIIDYNYFVLNKDSQSINESSAFLAYLTTEEGVEDYYETFPNRLSAHVSLTNSLETKIDEDFNIIYDDFLPDRVQFLSYDKGVKELYDTFIPIILDNELSATDKLVNMQTAILCRVTRIEGSATQNPSCN